MVLDLQGLFAGEQQRLPFSFSLDMSWYDRAGAYPFPDPVTVTGAVESRAGVVTLTGRAEGIFIAPCDRCLREVRRPVSVPLEHVVVTSLNREDNDELILAENGLLDVTALTESDILLFLPSRHLCREDCRGLCPRCGKDLNDGDCGCDARPTDPRWEGLRQLLS